MLTFLRRTGAALGAAGLAFAFVFLAPPEASFFEPNSQSSMAPCPLRAPTHYNKLRRPCRIGTGYRLGRGRLDGPDLGAVGVGHAEQRACPFPARDEGEA